MKELDIIMLPFSSSDKFRKLSISDFDAGFKHIYFTSSDEIREGEWCFEMHNGPSQAINPIKYVDINGDTWYLRQLNMNSSANSKTCKKVIASTNGLLSRYPLIPREWIEDIFIPNGGKVNKVRVETEVSNKWGSPGIGQEYRLMINPVKLNNDGEVIIKESDIEKSEKTYTKAQVMSLLISFDQELNPEKYGFSKEDVKNLVISEVHSMGLLEEFERVSGNIGGLIKDLK